MFDADKLVEICITAHGVIGFGDPEAHIEVERGGRSGVMHPCIYPVDLSGDRIVPAGRAGGGPPPKLKPFLGESTHISGLK